MSHHETCKNYMWLPPMQTFLRKFHEVYFKVKSTYKYSKNKNIIGHNL